MIASASKSNKRSSDAAIGLRQARPYLELCIMLRLIRCFVYIWKVSQQSPD